MVNVKRLKFFYESNEKNIKRAAIILVIIVALLVYLFSAADKNEIVVEGDGITAGQGVADGSGDLTGAGSTGENTTGNIYVDISGEVAKPGVYQVKNGARLFEVIELAGGLTKNADLNSINQAEAVMDGQKITIYTDYANQGASGANTNGQGNTSAGNPGGSAAISSDGRININLADSLTLQEITGVGPVTAEKIIDYRKSNGRFRSIEDLKNVSGIGDRTFEKIKGEITV